MGKNNQQRRRMKAKARRSHGETSSSQHRKASWGSAPAGSEALSDEHWLESSVRELSALGIQALDNKRQREFVSAVAQLVELAGLRSGRRVLVRTLTPMLEEDVTQAWLGGWQPADLHRVAGRELATADQAMLRDAVARELSTYAASTLDPRWAAQIREMGARVWWPADQTFLESRQQATGDGWEAVLTQALKVLHLLRRLPRLERLGPLPGTAVQSSMTRRPPGSPEVDERILSRVRALLAKAESTTFEAEAETFTAGAQALMARHSIDAALLAATREGREDTPQGRRIGIDNPYEAPKAMLLAAVADANRCRTVWSRAVGFTTVVGFAADLDAVETLFTSLLVQATHAMTREGSRTDRHGRSRTRAFRQSFLSAFAARIGERLSEVTHSETDKAANAAGGSGGRQLVPLLAARSAAVDDAVQAMFPDLVAHPLGLGSDAEGWHSGRSAADRAAIGSGAPIEPRGGHP
jgi:hypothetical protein